MFWQNGLIHPDTPREKEKRRGSNEGYTCRPMLQIVAITSFLHRVAMKRIAIIIDPYHVPISVIGFDEMSGSSVVRAGNDVNFIYLVVFSP